MAPSTYGSSSHRRYSHRHRLTFYKSPWCCRFMLRHLEPYHRFFGLVPFTMSSQVFRYRFLRILILFLLQRFHIIRISLWSSSYSRQNWLLELLKILIQNSLFCCLRFYSANNNIFQTFLSTNKLFLRYSMIFPRIISDIVSLFAWSNFWIGLD